MKPNASLDNLNIKVTVLIYLFTFFVNNSNQALDGM